MPRNAFDFFGSLIQEAIHIVRADQILQFFRFLSCLRQTDAQLIRDRIRPGLRLCNRESEYPCSITQRHFCRQRSKCGYLGNVVRTVFIPDIMQNIIPTIIRKIQIDIRHIVAFLVQKSLKQQIVFDWIDMGDAQDV